MAGKEVELDISDDENFNWLHRNKKKKAKEAGGLMEPFKPQDGEAMQDPPVIPTMGHRPTKMKGKPNRPKTRP